MTKRVGTVTIIILGLLLISSAALSLPALARQDAGAGFGAGLDLIAPLGAQGASTDLLGSADGEQEPSPATSWWRLPLLFIENQGQIDDQVAYYIQGKDKSLYFTPEGVTFVLSGADSTRWVLKLDFVGADPEVRPVGLDETDAVISYFRGRPEEWKTGLKTYAKVVYRSLWPGIDLEYSGTVNQLKYQFVVKPGADPSQIRLAYRGAAEVTISEAGQLEVSTPSASFQDGTPYAYQEIDGEQVTVGVSYEFPRAPQEPHVYGFGVGPYDQSRPLVLDPAILVYCGYIGGSGYDQGNGIAVDGYGFAYVTGDTASGETTFPETVGPDLDYNGGNSDAFVAKVSADGSALVYCGYLGGLDDDYGSDIVVDGSGHAYLVGWTESSQDDGFPVTGGPDLLFNGLRDAWVAKVRADGTGLLYCGYIGGSEFDYGAGITVDASGRAYVTGETESSQADGFPLLVGPDVTHNGGTDDAYVARVKADGSGLEFCGYIGGSGSDYGYGIAVDGSGRAHVVGATNSSQTTFPVLLGPDLGHNGLLDAFVARVKADGTVLEYCGYLGGSGDDSAWDIAVDAVGYAYMAGQTNSSEATFPSFLGPDLTHNGAQDAFVAKINTGGTGIVYCGYIGGSDDDYGKGIVLDHWGNAYVVGSTASSEGEGFPVFNGPDWTYNGGWRDAFAAKLGNQNAALVYCGYVGGSDTDEGIDIDVDGYGNAYVTGTSSSTQASFPVTVGPDLTHNSGGDAFVARIATSEVLVTKTLLDPPDGRAAVSDTVYCEILIENSGGMAITWMPLYDFHCPACLALTGWDVLPTDVDDVLGVVHWENVLDPAVGGPDVLAPGESMQVMVEFHAHVADTMYWKEGGWMDYAPKGMPDFDQKQYDWYDPSTGRWSFCGPVAAANSLWWFDSKFEPYPVPPPARSDEYRLVQSDSPWEYDDHDPQNVEPLVNDLAGWMGTTPESGTHVYGLADGLNWYIADQGMADHYTVQLVAEPEFVWVEEEVRRSEDVILLLGFWQDVGDWLRVGGHYVTVAGIDSENSLVAFSDPWSDWAESGYAGRVLPGSHGPFHLAGFHNLASWASHDVYAAPESVSPGGIWGPAEYAMGCDQIDNFQWQNEGDYPNEAECDPGWEIFTEVEYAVAVSPITPTLLCKPTDNIAVVGGALDEHGQFVREAQGHAQVRVNAAPTLGTIVPSSGWDWTEVTVYFETSWLDPNGWADLKQCYFHIGASPSLANNVTLMYNAAKDKLWLRDDSGTFWTGGYAPGSANFLENSQARVFCALTTVQRSGDRLSVTWAIEFKVGYEGDKKTGLKCKDRDKAKAKGKWKGTWTIM
jgi:hypothetical protein